MKNPIPAWTHTLQSGWQDRKAQPSATVLRFLRAHWPKALWASLITFLAIIALYLSVYFGAFGPLPTRAELRQVQNNEASIVYTADGQVIGRYYTHNRTTVTYAELPPHLIQALVATEDARFYQHRGVDWRSMPRVLWGVLTRQDKGGGSTIHQQLIKNIYPRRRYRFASILIHKCREIILAQRLHTVYSREEILTLYFNTVPFGELVYGIERAAYRYFGTSTQALTLLQSATLVGALKATTAYNPRLHPQAAEQRRNVVLRQMQRHRYLTAAQYDTLIQQPLRLDYHPRDPNHDLAPYFLQYIKAQAQPLLRQRTRPDGTFYDIERDGLRIHTTLQSTWQKAAQAAVHTELARQQKRHAFERQWDTPAAKKILLQDMRLTARYQARQAAGWTEAQIREDFQQPIATWVFNWGSNENRTISPWDSMIHYKSLLRAGFLVTEPHNGYIRAWVGGPNHQYLPFDNVTAQRQAGSTFKPILYAAALESGEHPCSFYPNDHHQYTEFGGWTPDNADGQYGGWYTLHGGLTHSVNTVAARLMQKVYIDSTIPYAQRMGITSDIPRQPSIALGTSSVDLLELATVYGTIANEGRKQPLTALLRIEDRQGKVLYQAPATPQPQPVLEPSTALQLRAMLESVVDSGTARSLREVYRLRGPIAGKTGTTQNAADARFVGFTPRFVGVAWVGGEYPTITRDLGSGSSAALPIWARFYQNLTRQHPYRTFPEEAFSPLPVSLQYDYLMYTTDSTLVFPRRRPILDFFDRLVNGEDPSPRRPRAQAPPKKKKGFWKRLFGGG